jgi:hypothetical protein
MKRCEGALEKIDGKYEQCDSIAEGGSDFCWECNHIGNKKMSNDTLILKDNCPVEEDNGDKP